MTKINAKSKSKPKSGVQAETKTKIATRRHITLKKSSQQIVSHVLDKNKQSKYSKTLTKQVKKLSTKSVRKQNIIKNYTTPQESSQVIEIMPQVFESNLKNGKGKTKGIQKSKNIKQRELIGNGKQKLKNLNKKSNKQKSCQTNQVHPQLSQQESVQQSHIHSSQSSQYSHTQYKVQKIVSSKFFDNKIQYQIKWVGYADSQNTYEPLSHLNNVILMVVQFQQQQRRTQQKLAKQKQKLLTSTIKQLASAKLQIQTLKRQLASTKSIKQQLQTKNKKISQLQQTASEFGSKYLNMSKKLKQYQTQQKIQNQTNPSFHKNKRQKIQSDTTRDHTNDRNGLTSFTLQEGINNLDEMNNQIKIEDYLSLPNRRTQQQQDDYQIDRLIDFTVNDRNGLNYKVYDQEEEIQILEE